MSRLQTKERPDCNTNADDSDNDFIRTIVPRVFIRQRLTGIGRQNQKQKHKRPDANDQICHIHPRTLLSNITHRQEVKR